MFIFIIWGSPFGMLSVCSCCGCFQSVGDCLCCVVGYQVGCLCCVVGGVCGGSGAGLLTVVVAAPVGTLSVLSEFWCLSLH